MKRRGLRIGLAAALALLPNSGCAEQAAKAEALRTLIRIATVFSDNSLLQERLEAVAGGNGPQTVRLNETDWIRTDGSKIEVHLERPLV